MTCCEIAGCSYPLFFPHYAVVILEDGSRLAICYGCWRKIRSLRGRDER